MNWRRGLFRLWIVGTALFVLAIAFVSYSEIKAQTPLLQSICMNCTGNTSGIAVKRRATALEC
jgi:hypothetical protein